MGSKIMDWKFFIQLLATLLVAIAGWWIGHYLSARRDISNERRKIVTEYLLSAYQNLVHGANRHSPGAIYTDEQRVLFRDKIESAVEAIHLLGSQHQIDLVSKFSSAHAAGQNPSLDPLLSDL